MQAGEGGREEMRNREDAVSICAHVECRSGVLFREASVKGKGSRGDLQWEGIIGKPFLGKPIGGSIQGCYCV